MDEIQFQRKDQRTDATAHVFFPMNFNRKLQTYFIKVRELKTTLIIHRNTKPQIKLGTTSRNLIKENRQELRLHTILFILFIVLRLIINYNCKRFKYLHKKLAEFSIFHRF